MIKRKIDVEIEPTAVELAEHVSSLAAEDQAEFLNLVAKEFDGWHYGRSFIQIYEVSEQICLTDAAKRFVSVLNDYINPKE